MNTSPVQCDTQPLLPSNTEVNPVPETSTSASGAAIGKRKERDEGEHGTRSDYEWIADTNVTIWKGEESVLEHTSDATPSSSSTNPNVEDSDTSVVKCEVHIPKKPRLDAAAVSAQTAQLFEPGGSLASKTDPSSSLESKPCGILSLPLELLAEIMILTGSPQHVLATARTSKTLCDTLLSPDAEFIWREARKGSGCVFEVQNSMFVHLGKETFSLPEPPKQFFGEPAYAAFVFDSGNCEACGNETAMLYQSFALRFRLCKKQSCLSSRSLKPVRRGDNNIVDPATAIIPTNEASSLDDKVSYNSGSIWPNTTRSYCRPAAWEEAVRFHSTYSSRDNYNEMYRRRQERNLEWMKLCVQLYNWNRARTLIFKRNVESNENTTKILASKYGWERGELLNTDFGHYLRYKNKVIERINEIDVRVLRDNIESRLLALTEKRDRRNGEVALMNGRKDVEKAYQHLRSSKEYPYLPSLATFRKLPVVAMLQSAETPSSTGTVFDSLTKDKTVKDLLISQLKKWVDSAKSDFGVILGFPKNWKTASKNILHPVERVTARFLCTRCPRLDTKYRPDESLDFAGACLHECFVGNAKHARLRTGKKSVWDSKNFVKDDKAINVLKKAVSALGFAEDRDGGNYLLQVGFALVCTSCDPSMVLDSRSIIGHSHRHEDMQCSFTTPLDDIVGYMGGFPYEYGLVKKLLVPTTPPPIIKQEIDKKNYGCRHCLRDKQVKAAALAAAASTNDDATANGAAPGIPAAAIHPTSASANLAAMRGPQIQLSALVYRPHDLGVEGPHDKPPPLTNFNGMRSHLKSKEENRFGTPPRRLLKETFADCLALSENFVVSPPTIPVNRIANLTMVAYHTFIFALGAFLSLPQDVCANYVQKQGLVAPPQASQYKDAVKAMFTDSYSVYKQYAWGHDDVSPISKSFRDGRNGWGASIVDAMTTMKIMDLDDLFLEAVEFASNIDFSESNTEDTVSVFESTIRYIGGLLSSYELSGKQYPALVNKAKQLADKLSFAWVGTNDIPFGHIDFSNDTPQNEVTNIAEAGTLTLEWAVLSKYVGDDKYRKLAEKSARHIVQGPAPLPGLPGQGVDPASGLPVGKYVTWGGGSDSYFEYLIKYPRLNNTLDALFVDSWRTAVDSSIHTLLKRSTVGNYTYLADYDDNGNIVHISSHLACFHGGNWLLGGRLLKNQTLVDIGLDLVDACWNTYTSTSTGIGPEVFAFRSADGGYTGGNPMTLSQSTFYQEHGFYTTVADYVLRPEVLESNFYAWRVTGDSKYVDRAIAAVQSFQKYLKVPGNGVTGYAGLMDVNDSSSDRVDDTESFWFAEVLKYLYLTLDDPSKISLDKYVFNTEAHPFEVPAAADTYGSGGYVPHNPPTQTAPGTLPLVSSLPAIPKLTDYGLLNAVANGIAAIL
ncbi:putative mannosyl-oligosaccharide alpha-1,2-mannosidase 1B [Psilocybe cubensis]|uniref:alpha-1,2-Mannosidase n=2 Tax=Psilocybe cubensis TaxID=181762 RepID=A0A8H8CIX9_PSICU|nr:putative mannosyl-oligosaccharide alpha-1,2-mannosidase 1B [Psilocybe cubensis]KAH9478544.1 putative mannosyl-oligosaccharide alpha-1,2-mannosidase 1B [Psilocybe cubensis]